MMAIALQSGSQKAIDRAKKSALFLRREFA
jgi:hypothetical protein